MKEELATLLGIVDSARLENVLGTALDLAEMTTALKGRIIDNAAVEAIDFSDASDGRWEAELERARQEAELVRARETAESRALIAGVEDWMMSGGHAVREGRSGGGCGDGDASPPPPLVSDSESEDGGASVVAWESDADDDHVCGTKRRASGKKGRGKKKGGSRPPLPAVEEVEAVTSVGTVVAGASSAGAPPAPADNGGLNAAALGVAFVPGVGAAAATAAGMGVWAEESGRSGQRRGARAGGIGETNADVEDYMVVEGWVKGVAAGRVGPRAAQLQRYFRGRVDKCESWRFTRVRRLFLCV